MAHPAPRFVPADWFRVYGLPVGQPFREQVLEACAQLRRSRPFAVGDRVRVVQGRTFVRRTGTVVRVIDQHDLLRVQMSPVTFVRLPTDHFEHADEEALPSPPPPAPPAPTFEPGDLVRVKGEAPWHGGEHGKVMGMLPQGVVVEVPSKSRPGEVTKVAIEARHLEVVPTFKIGDRVMLKSTGEVCEVVEVHPNSVVLKVPRANGRGHGFMAVGKVEIQHAPSGDATPVTFKADDTLRRLKPKKAPAAKKGER